MLSCARCGRTVDQQDASLPEVSCFGCGAHLEIQAFPALRRGDSRGSSGESLDDDSEAACFKHSGKKAVEHCSQCGRFLCALCEVDLSGEVVCFDCFAESASESSGKLERRAVLYDSVALALALWPILFWIVTVVTAPIALFVVIRYWKTPGGLVPRTRIRFVVAAGIALLQLAGWVSLAAILVTGGGSSG